MEGFVSKIVKVEVDCAQTVRDCKSGGPLGKFTSINKTIIPTI